MKCDKKTAHDLHTIHRILPLLDHLATNDYPHIHPLYPYPTTPIYPCDTPTTTAKNKRLPPYTPIIPLRFVEVFKGVSHNRV